MHAAFRSGELNTFNDLLKAGEEKLIDVKNVSGRKPIQLAVTSGNLSILETLYSGSKDSASIFEEIDIDGRTSFHLAVEHKTVEIVKWLLDKGARTDVRAFGDSTPFQRAFQVGIFKILRLLFSNATKITKLLSASQWRFVQSGDSDKIIVMTKGSLATVEMMDNKQLNQYLNDRSYSLAASASNMGTKEKSMAVYTPEKRVLRVPRL